MSSYNSRLQFVLQYEQLELDFEDEFKRLKTQKEVRDKEKLARLAKEEEAQRVKANKVKPVQTNEVKHIIK